MGDNEPKPLAVDLLTRWLDADGRTQGQLAKSTELNQSNISRHLRGVTPSLSAAFRYEAVTGGRVKPKHWLSRKDLLLLEQIREERGESADRDQEIRALMAAVHDYAVAREVEDVRWRRFRIGVAMAMADLDEIKD